MGKQIALAGVLVVSLTAGGYVLARHSTRRPASAGKTLAPAAAARQWLQAHGYLDENGHRVPRPQPGP
jgi:hypothetical protein